LKKPEHIQHLLVFSPGFPSSENDTTCLPAVQQFLLAYKEVFPDCHISVISLHYPFARSIYTWQEVNVQAIGGSNKNGIRRGFTITRAIAAARKVHKVQKVDAVLSLWLTDTALTGKYFAKIYKLPHLIWMHGQDARPGNKYVKLVGPRSVQLAAISKNQSEVYHSAYKKEAKHIINNGVNPSGFPLLNTGKRTIDFLAAGNLVPLKQYHLFIELLAYLKSKGHSFKAVLAGEGILHSHLDNLKTEYDLTEELRIVDKLPHAELLQLMNSSRVFIHPSSYEGHSTVMLEALYSGCHVISFIPPADEKVDHSYTCSNMDEMKRIALSLVSTNLPHQRVLVNDMKNSVLKLNAIIKQL
jgi:glycosyltransferase involved in cell wall biosynthesis